MKNISKLLVVFYLLLFQGSHAQTIVSGGIYQNTTWTLANSPYQINGSVVVFPRVTLTVEPGVTLLINNTSAQDLYIETRGTLNLVGTNQAPIIVKTMMDTTNIGWEGFKCTSTQGGILNADYFHVSNALTPFAYESALPLIQYTDCRFSHCGQAISVANEVILNNCQFRGNEVGVYGWSYFNINNCYFKDNNTAIFVYSTAFTLTNSAFIENASGVVFASGVFDSMYIADCIFQNNQSGISGPNNGLIENCTLLDNAVGIQGSYDCQIKNNVIEYNELGVNISVHTELTNNLINSNMGGVRISDISSSANAPTVQDNEICGNINFNVDNNTNVNYSLLTNCFCGVDSATIEQYLIDGYDDITKGLINYQIFDSSCNNVFQTVMKFNAPVGLNDITNLDIAFQNPVGDELIFLSNNGLEIRAITLIDPLGKTYQMGSNSINIFDLSDLPQGIYFLSSINETNILRRIIKI
jgi:hypothetical protein